MILRSVLDLRATVASWRPARVGLVPTMGALHEGHLSLVRAARAECDRVLVSIFVNPAQFNNPDDLAKYPRTEGQDVALLSAAGVDAIFAPPPEEVYPPGFASKVSVAGVSGPLEGAHRPGHFDGVATVVTKLFGMTGADRAYFGEKDWQQLQVVRRFVADLNLGIEIVGCPTLREADGLAMSSRNTRLSPAGRAVAPALHRAMLRAAEAIRAGAPPEAALGRATSEVLAAGFASVDYLELHRADLSQLASAPPARMLAAAVLEDVRLIDNIEV